MPLSYTGITAGSTAASAQLKQVLDLLTGVMTDQAVYVANTIRASTTGATSAVFFAGGTATSFPALGAHGTGEIVAALDGKWWMCTAPGTPGTWIQMGASLDGTAGDYATLVAAGSAAVPGSTGKGADAGHQHPAIINPAGGFTGNLLLLQLGSADRFKVDQTGLLTTVAGAIFSGPLSGVTTLAIAGALSGVTTIAMSGALTGATGVTATNLTGTLQTAAQPNITSLGTIASLVATILTLADSTSNTVPTLPSGNGARIWIQATDPGGSARDGDLWVHG
jgi:hypothetical protein